MTTLEQRYIVIKIKDMEEALLSLRKTHLFSIMEAVTNWRETNNKKSLTGVFIESDCPEYAPTVSLLEKRIKKESDIPKENGLYWFLHNGAQHPVTAQVYAGKHPTACFIGSSQDHPLEELEGVWLGKVIPPKKY